MPVGDAVERLRHDGWVVLPGVIPDPLVAELRDGVARTIDRLDTGLGANPFLGERTRRVFNLLAHDPVFGVLPIHRRVLEIAEQLLDDDLLLSSLTAVETHPGQEAQPLHADDGSIPVPRPHEPLAVVAIWALTDFTRENGGTRIAPGSHRRDRRPRPGEPADTVTVEMEAGSVLLYNGSAWHGGGANDSDACRRFVVCNYCAGWLRQEESQLLGLDRDHVAAMPPRLRRLVGYGVYRGLQGHVAGVDPGSWFDDDTERDLVWARMR